jgi:hypothetical protein
LIIFCFQFISLVDFSPEILPAFLLSPTSLALFGIAIAQQSTAARN